MRLSQDSQKVFWSTESFTPLTQHRILIKDVSYFLILLLSQEINNVIQSGQPEQSLSIAALHIQWSNNQLENSNNSVSTYFLSLTTFLLRPHQPHSQLKLQPSCQVQTETEVSSQAAWL